MKLSTVQIAESDGNVIVPSLRPYLRASLEKGQRMDLSVMRPEDREHCAWIGFGIGKGVTDPQRNVSVFAVPENLESGLHGELIQEFPGVDPVPLCYERFAHKNGFGRFVRWVYFADPAGGPGYIGVDWSLVERATAGVAVSMKSAGNVFAALAAHGLPKDTKTALLNWRMCEHPSWREIRVSLGLETVADWELRAPALFGPKSRYCPRCGAKTLAEPAEFCSQCGCKPALFWKGGGHGMEI
ncbi:MAG: hypothetical protein Q8P82_01240 [bacterium]|nr:hypothetical protein [bacterium]